jgi:VWFA-related protein
MLALNNLEVRSFVAVLVCSSLLLAPVCPAQTPTQQQPVNPRSALPPPAKVQEPKPGQTIRAFTDLVLVDVQVTDRKGNPVKGLKPEQFTLTEDDQPQKVSSFDYYDIEAIEMAAAEDSRPVVVSLGTVAAPEQVREAVKDRRMIVLFFDLSSMQPDELLRAIDAGQKFVQGQMTPADLVAVVAFGNVLTVRAPFTNDKAVLARAIGRLRPGKEANLAEMGETPTEEEQTEESFTADQTEFNIFNTDRKLAALESVAELLRGIPGRKSLIHFTGGVTQTGQENRSQLRAATDAANRANVSLYTVDARGLQASVPGGEARSESSRGTQMYSGAAVFRQVDSRNDSRETLETLARDTGGRSFFDSGDFQEVFEQVQKDAAGYYLLGYYSSNPQRDGRWRRLRVKVNAPDVRLRVRDGYYAPKDYGVFTAEDRERQLDEAMRSETPRVELALALETAFFRTGPNEVFVPIAAKLASSALEWAQKRGRHEAVFDFATEIREEQSNTVVAALRDSVRVRLEADRFREVQQRAIVYQGGLLLGPGHYRLKFLARETESGRIGTFEQDLVIPAAQPDRLDLSSVLLSHQLEASKKSSEVQKKAFGAEVKMERSPLEVGGERIVPSVTRVFTTQQRLYVFFQAYLPPQLDAGRLRAGLVFFREGERRSETPLVEPAEVYPKTRTASFRISLPLERLTPGRYSVQAVVVELDGGQAAFGRSYFALRAPAPQPAPKAAPGN